MTSIGNANVDDVSYWKRRNHHGRVGRNKNELDVRI